jgi:lipopolysaccharide/colanic/teichoic acid biosynthesis glycosyltransferase
VLADQTTLRADAAVASEASFALPPHYRSFSGLLQRAAKRVLDVVAAAAGLVILTPLFLVIALLVVLDSGVPIFYRWRVVGRRGRYFTGYKFRTMVPNADVWQPALADRNEMTGPVFKMRSDPRVTRIGRLLRRYSVDELPQLWCVLKGDMSLVGPRPPLQDEWVRFEPWQRRKLAVTPGITCLWQVSGRAEITGFAEWARMDIAYIERWNLGLDLWILWRTVWAVLSQRGAY